MGPRPTQTCSDTPATARLRRGHPLTTLQPTKLCNRHWLNRVPGPVTDLGVACLPFTLAGYADLPLTLLGAPVSIGADPGHGLPGPNPQDLSGRPPGTGPHVPVRHNRGSAVIPSSRSRWRIGLKPTRLHLDAHKYMEKKHRRVPATPKSWGVEPHPLTNMLK